MGAQRSLPWVALAVLAGAIAAGLLLLRADSPSGASSAAPLARTDPSAPAPWDASAISAPDSGPPIAAAAADATVESAAVRASDSTSLLVRVTWASDGRPAADVGLRIVSWTRREPHRYARVGRTNAQGEWLAPSIAAGRTTASVDRGGSQSGVLAPGEAGELDVAIPPGVLIRGLVTTDAQEPVADAEVYVLSEDDDVPVQPEARSDAAGRFELRDVQPGTWLQARSRIRTPSQRVLVGGEAGGAADVSLVVGFPGCTVRGTVTDWWHSPVGDALVRVGPAAWPAVFVRSDAAGVFLAEGVRTGLVPIAAVAPGLSPAETHVQLEAGETAEVALLLGPSSSLSGRVRDAQGRIVAGAQVFIGEPGDMLRSEDTTAADGSYKLADIAPGLRLVTAAHPTAGRSTVRMGISANDRATWDPVLGSGSVISGTILDASGAPAAGLRVEARPIDDSLRGRSQTSTDAAGAFELQDVPVGPQQLLARGGPLGGLEIEIASPVEPGTRDLVLRLPDRFLEPGHIVGRLVDPNGAPVAGEVHVTNVATDAAWKARADARTGRFDAGPLPLGRYAPDVQPDDRPARDFPEVVVPAGATVDIGDLVLPGGGRIVAYITAPGPITGSADLGTYVYCHATAGDAAESLELADGEWRSPPVPPGEYVLIIHTRDYAAPYRKLLVEEGRDTEVHVSLLPGVHQELRFFATPPAGASGLAFDFVVRTPAGEDAWGIRNETIPVMDRPAEAEGGPLLAFDALLLPGTYLVDLTLGDRTLTAEAHTTDAATPWVFDLR